MSAPFSLPEALEVLERTPGVITRLLSGLSVGWTTHNEGGESWSPWDVVGHLIHGEETDWLPRLRLILEGDGRFEPFDRLGHLEKSRGRSLDDLLAEFGVLREGSLAALRALDLQPAQLDLEGTHPEFGRVSVRQLLAAWVVHDLGHIAQIARVMAKQYREPAGPWVAYLPILGDRS